MNFEFRYHCVSNFIQVVFNLWFAYSLEKPLNFDPFGHARFAHLFVLYD